MDSMTWAVSYLAQILIKTPYRGFEFNLWLATQKNGVTGTALFQATTRASHLHVESAIAQSLHELSIILGSPDRQNALRLESRVGGGYSTVVIEPGVFRRGKCGRAVVYVE